MKPEIPWIKNQMNTIQRKLYTNIPMKIDIKFLNRVLPNKIQETKKQHIMT